MANPPKVENAPGLVWRRRRDRWAAQWQARSDAVRKGFWPTAQRIWIGAELDDQAREWIAQTCQRLQAEMHVWLKGGIPAQASRFNGTLAGLIDCYQEDADSRYQKLRYRTRRNYDSHLRRIVREHGNERLEDIKSRTLLRWHEDWCAEGHTTLAHALIGIIRSLLSFGRTILEDDDKALGGHCARLGLILHDMRFPGPGVRQTAITAQQAIALRAVARQQGHYSIALAQAFQFELMLRQRDVIGEWLPLDEPGISDMTHGQLKWHRGLRWNEIDQNMILRHTTSKRGKVIEVDLKLAPMVMEELHHHFADTSKMVGPVIVREKTGLPWRDHDYRRYWRMLANACGIPKEVYNMDSRAGGITEATDAGAELEHVRHAATHSNISMTQRYSRGSIDKVAGVMRTRVAHRNKNDK